MNKGGICKRFGKVIIDPKTPLKTLKYLSPLIPPLKGGTPKKDGVFGGMYGGADET